MRSIGKGRTAATLAVLVASAFISTGCTGSEPEEATTATVSVVVTTTVTGTSSSAPSIATAGSSLAPDTDLSSSPAPATPLQLRHEGALFFQTPSGNIGCYLLWYGRQRSVECALKARDFENPPRPADCDLDWVAQFVLGQDSRYGACRGDVSGQPTDLTLPYGNLASNGPIKCVSQETGLTCSNLLTDHGFEVSRASYRLF